MNEYRGRVRFVWRNNPLPFHQSATPAAEAAMEAFAQGGNEKFWQMHDKLFENQRALSRADLERYAQEIGLDMNRFRQALDSHTHQARVQEDMRLAAQLGARGTPAFFINGVQLMGAQPYERFQEIIDREVRNAEQLARGGTPREELYARITANGRTSPAPEPGAQPGAGADQQPQQPRRMPDPAAVYKLEIAGDEPQRGPDDALVTMVVFSEFECPFCSRVKPTIDQLLTDYGRDLRLVWMNNPLPFHRNAGPAANAALEAYEQRGNEAFWRMHDLLFENQRELSREKLEELAGQVGLNMAQFRAALDNNEHNQTIEAQQAKARSLGASGTPSFFINGRNVRGAQPLEAFKRVIDEELARARQLLERGTPRAQVYAAAIREGHTEPQFIEPPPGAPGAGAAPPRPEPPPDQVYQIAVPPDAPTHGPASAQVTIQIFSDFECPFCGRVLPTIEQIKEQYGNRVRFVWRNYPLPFHQNAGPAAQAAVEVHRQGGNEAFWRFHDLLFQNQRALARADLERYAEQVGGINMAAFRAALDNGTHRARVEADMEAVTRAGAQIGTPSFFINGRLLQGAQPFDAFRTAIDRAISERR
jgi:protein-disulfide isomerase